MKLKVVKIHCILIECIQCIFLNYIVCICILLISLYHSDNDIIFQNGVPFSFCQTIIYAHSENNVI